MALPFRSIFGLADESGNQFDPAFGSGEQERSARRVAGPTETVGRDGMFTVEADSLSEAIPEELRSSVTTHSSRVTLRLDDAEWEPGDAEVSTRLVQVYRACPQLFTVVIDEAVDVPVRLRLAGGGDSTLAVPPLPVIGSGATNSFQSLPSAGTVAQAPVNPFSSPLVRPMELPAGPPPLPAAGNSPFVVAPAGPPKDAASQISPFLAAITGTAMPSAVPVGLPPVLKPQPQQSEAGSPEELRLSFPFHVLLGQIEPSVLGINPAALPLDWRTHLPWSFVKPQFVGGRVMASLAKLVEHADPAAKVGLQGVNGAIEVSIPLKEIVRQLPQSEILPGPAALVVEEKAAVNPFQNQAQEEAIRGFVPLKEAPPAMLDPTAPVRSPFRIAPDATVVDRREEEVVAPLSFGKGMDSLDELKGVPFESSRAAIALPPYAQPLSSLPLMPAGAAAQAGETMMSPLAQQIASGKPALPPLQPMAPVASGEAERSLLRFDGVGVQPMVQDLELRAVFGRSEAFTRQFAIDLTSGLPGILGCLLFTAPEATQVLAKSQALSPEIDALVSRMPRMYQRIQGLAEDLGFESGEAFTLRTNQGMVSFFSHGQVCLSVLQESEKSDAGLWARLVLIARGMSALRE